MRADFELSHILDGATLRKIASALGVRYVFQPYLAAFTQTMTDRWSFPPIDLRVTQTRSSIMRLSLQLWDAETGECLQVFEGHEAGVVAAAFSHDQRRVFSCDWSGGIRVWDRGR